MAGIQEWAEGLLELAVAEGKVTPGQADAAREALARLGEEMTPLAVVRLYTLLKNLQFEGGGTVEPSESEIRKALERIENRQANILGEASDARALLRSMDRKLDDLLGPSPAPPPPPGPNPPPPPEPGPQPPTPGDYRFVADPAAKSWRLEGIVEDWSEPLMLPTLPFSGPLTEAFIELEVEIGPEGFGSTFLELFRDRKKWSKGGSGGPDTGDTILLLNRGLNGNLAASHTLAGAESEPVRTALPLRPGDRVIVEATLQAGEKAWVVNCEKRADTDMNRVYGVVMKSPPVTVKSRLGLQLGSHGDSSHRTNAGCRLLRFEGRVA